MLAPGKVKIAVGTILKTHGIKGELNVELTDMAEPADDFAAGACVILEIDGLDVPFFVAACRPRGAESVLLTLDDVTSDADAASLVGQTVYVYADPAELNEELTAGDLVGFTILTDSGAIIGRIDQLVELTPGAWYFSVGGRLIPAVDEFIREIDSERLAVTVSLPDGLLEL